MVQHTERALASDAKDARGAKVPEVSTTLRACELLQAGKYAIQLYDLDICIDIIWIEIRQRSLFWYVAVWYRALTRFRNATDGLRHQKHSLVIHFPVSQIAVT